MKHIKKYLSLFCLILFLFPLVEKNVHAFEHYDEVHCNSTDKHFHELEHTCSLCDFTITESYSAESDYQLIISAKQFLFHPFIESVNTPHAFQDLPARAPPVSLT
ncbi:MAG: hypothetical protein ACT4ON_05335 [Bacteroidota bacterium]